MAIPLLQLFAKALGRRSKQRFNKITFILFLLFLAIAVYSLVQKYAKGVFHGKYKILCVPIYLKKVAKGIASGLKFPISHIWGKMSADYMTLVSIVNACSSNCVNY